MSTILSVDNLQKRFGGITAVDGATFDVEKGSITGIIGPNGAGKTTTFNLMSGFYEPDGGTVRYDGRDLQQLMTPSRHEQTIWGGASALTVGATSGIVGAGALAAGGIASVGLAALGAGAGAGIYAGRERLSQRGSTANSRPYMLAREGLVRTFQITRELSEMTALQNLMLAPQGQAGENLLNTWFRRDDVMREEQQVRERATEMLELLEIDHVRDEPAENLSGGQRKLLELGRVLMLEPTVILLDEPMAGVNPTLTTKLTDRIKSLREEGYTFCIIEHDMELIMQLCDTIVVLDEGTTLVEGQPEEIQQDQQVLDAYLGAEQ